HPQEPPGRGGARRGRGARPADNPGRITVWIDDKIEHFNPDGSDVSAVELSSEVKAHSYGIQISPDRSTACYCDVVSKGDKIESSRLVLALVAGGSSFVLKGYTVDHAVFANDGKRAFFTGSKGDVYSAETPVEVFELTLASKQITAINRLPK